MSGAGLTMASPHLLSMPTEILQSIYLHCLSTHLPHASPILSSALSAEHIYKAMLLYAFWTRMPLLLTGKEAPQQAYEPGPNVRALFHPLPVPRAGTETDEAETQSKLQSSVLSYRWCTFPRAKRYFSEMLSAVTQDLLLTLQFPLSPPDQARLEAFTAQLPIHHFEFSVSTDSDPKISIKLWYPRRLATALLAIYRGPDPNFNTGFMPTLIIQPTTVLAIPSHILIGQPKWTDSAIDCVQMLFSHVNLLTVEYSLSALYTGMTNAIVQGKYEALLTLLFQSDRLRSNKNPTSSHDESEFGPPAELFRLVAKRHMHRLAPSNRNDSDTKLAKFVDDTSTDITLFTLLLRAHAECMPLHDPTITTWADLLTFPNMSEETRAFGQWVLDWSRDESRDSQHMQPSGRRRIGGADQQRARMPLFVGGAVSRSSRYRGIANRFERICGGKVERFDQEVERVGAARDA